LVNIGKGYKVIQEIQIGASNAHMRRETASV